MNLSIVSRVLALLSCVSFGLTLWRWWAVLRFPLRSPRRGGRPCPAALSSNRLEGLRRRSPNPACGRGSPKDCPGPVQFLLGVASADDPACAVVRELMAEFPRADAQLVLCERQLGVNSKVSKLRQLEPLVRHPLVVISDADVSITRPISCPKSVAPQFADTTVGLVNCFYRLTNPADPTLAMRWETIAINCDFWSSVLQAQSFQKVDFALGAVVALPQRRSFSPSGALPPWPTISPTTTISANLSRRKASASFFPPSWWNTTNPTATGRKSTNSHQVRWARTIRACQPAAFLFSVFLTTPLSGRSLWLAANGAGHYYLLVHTVLPQDSPSPVPAHALLGAIGCPAPSFPACCLFFAFRIATALHQEKRLTGATEHLAWFWMIPLKDLLNVGIWAAAFIGNHIEWRGQRHRILPGGCLEKSG